MIITKEIVEAVYVCISATNDQADELTKLPEFSASNRVGEIIRQSEEQMRQKVDLLSGWVARAKIEMEKL